MFVTVCWDMIFNTKCMNLNRLYACDIHITNNEINKNDLNEIIKFDNNLKLINKPRQIISNVKYTKKYLLQFNEMSYFYDINLYLNQLILNANIINKQYQNSMKLVINNILNEMNINNNKNKLIVFQSGPIKYNKIMK